DPLVGEDACLRLISPNGQKKACIIRYIQLQLNRFNSVLFEALINVLSLVLSSADRRASLLWEDSLRQLIQDAACEEFNECS
ncbi:MAG TPA: hypothetical protein VLX29_01845, partial [Nitrospirota bacterium]|nr:hypothetical protein [Nitrospirota bacterium]